MFGRRRHAAAALPPIDAVVQPAPPLPRLAEEQIFELVHTRIAAAIGEDGEWVVRRRLPDDTDDIFRGVLAHQVALDVTAALRSAQLQLESGQAITVSTRTGAVPIVSGAQSIAPKASDTDAAADPSGGLEAVEHLATVDDIDEAASRHGDSTPSHRHDESDVEADADLDEDSLAMQWEPAPITVWTDLKKPVTGPIALEHLRRDLVA